jgi:hypothetical protein
LAQGRSFDATPIGERLKVSAAHVAYLESGKRSPSGAVMARYRRFIPS